MTRNPNEYIVIGDITHIILTNRQGSPICSAVIDTKNLRKVSPFRWHHSQGYCQTKIKGVRITLQFVILGSDKEALPGIRIIDHGDNDGLNNLESNLQYVTYKENRQNSEHYREVHGDENYKPKIVRIKKLCGGSNG